MTDPAGRHVVITGAASGIGRLLAERLARRGARLSLWDVDREGLDRLVRSLRADGGTAEAFVCDLARRDAIRETAKRVLQGQGPVGLLINNAGVVNGRTLLESSEDQIEATFRINTLALFHTTRAFLPGMLDQGDGHIVTVASAGGIVGTSRLVDYCSSKFAAFGFDESLRLELRRLDAPVRTTVVCPFYIDTGMFAGVKTRFRWLLPILKPEHVADRIMGAIEKDRARLVMPRFVYTTWLARLLPTRLFDAVMDFLGVSRSMDDFRGRSSD